MKILWTAFTTTQVTFGSIKHCSKTYSPKNLLCNDDAWRCEHLHLVLMATTNDGGGGTFHMKWTINKYIQAVNQQHQKTTIFPVLKWKTHFRTFRYHYHDGGIILRWPSNTSYLLCMFMFKGEGSFFVDKVCLTGRLTSLRFCWCSTHVRKAIILDAAIHGHYVLSTMLLNYATHFPSWWLVNRL